MHPLLTHLTDQFTTHQDRLANARLFVAVSGGRDSLALTHACGELHKMGVLPSLPTLIHVNHQMQSASDEWANQVAQFAKRHGFVHHIKPVNVAGGSENAARQARFKAFFELMNDSDVLLLAHHADDQAETMLMRLINGAGVAGLSAMKPWQIKQNPAINDDTSTRSSHHNTQANSIHLFRPCLGARRAILTDYCHAHHLDYIDDPTNIAGDNTRSVLRREILPIFNQLNPQAVSNIARSAAHVQAAQGFVNDGVALALAACTDVQSFTPTNVLYLDNIYEHRLHIPTWQAAHQAIKPLILQKFIQNNSPLPCDGRLLERAAHLMNRTDNDHATTLYWQGADEAVVLVRYDDVLYRYRMDFWQALQGEFVWRDRVFISLDEPHISIATPMNSTPSKLHRHDKVSYRQQQLAGKKLAQTLRIPPWLREHLWLVDGKIVSVGRVWGLD
ncbi:MAG: tRNA lysidine(34) synthetase TilS [Moraxella sp.]|nr:tRNA lysidine(34) synthetase TilS [Moraxella sp.]